MVETSQVPEPAAAAATLPATPIRPVEERVFDARALLGGILVSVLIAGGALHYKFAGQKGVLKPPQAFEFTVAEPAQEEFKLREIQRDILQERREEASEDLFEKDERPNMHFTTDPEHTAPHDQEVIQSSNNTVDTSRIEVGATEINVDTGPAEISQVSDVVQYAITPIAVDVGGAADFLKYKDPAPRDRPASYFMNTAPAPGRNLRTLPKAFGDQNTPGSGQLGAMNINLNGTGEFFRNGPKFGDVKAKTAVDGCLHWLALHQDSDGLWHAEKLEGAANSRLAVTGLACLAFLGAGNTTTRGEYVRNVNKGIEALLRNQNAAGAFVEKSAGGHLMYTHGICTIAVCEAYGRSREERLLSAAQKAVGFLEKAVNADGGWRYTPKSGDSDISVTAWAIQALKTAKLAQIKFEHSVFSQAITYLAGCTDKGEGPESTGAVGYQFKPDKSYPNSNPALTCAGMLIRQFNGVGVKNPLLQRPAELTRANPPDWKRKDFYYWYYATYAMHNLGGEFRIWWNKRIRDVLFENQVRGGEHAGSWDPKGDKWGFNTGGRTYTTALGALCLEVYYRYSEALNSFGAAPDLDELLFKE